MPYKDPKIRKEKAKIYSKRHYENNKKELIARGKEYKKTRKNEWIDFKQSLECAFCGEKHHATFDFHHLEKHPSNRKVSALLANHNYGAAFNEVSKCIVLCANCHRIHHFNEDKKKRLLNNHAKSNITKRIPKIGD